MVTGGRIPARLQVFRMVLIVDGGNTPHTRIIRRALLVLQKFDVFSPQEIAAHDATGKLKAASISNFLSPKKIATPVAEPVYRTNLDVPRLQWVQNYLVAHLDVLVAKISSTEGRDLVYAATQLTWGDSEEYLWSFFETTGVLDAESKKEILERCGGTFYLLRYDAYSDDVVCSILRVMKGEIPNCAPRFTNTLAEARIDPMRPDQIAPPRKVHGHIGKFGDTYGFLGFVEGRTDYKDVRDLQSWAGLKTIVFRVDRTGLHNKIGVFFSLIGGGAYHFGTMLAVKVRKFDETKTKIPPIRAGFYKFDDLARELQTKNDTRLDRARLANSEWPGHEYRSVALTVP
jgi:hypothetical protein